MNPIFIGKETDTREERAGAQALCRKKKQGGQGQRRARLETFGTNLPIESASETHALQWGIAKMSRKTLCNYLTQSNYYKLIKSVLFSP